MRASSSPGTGRTTPAGGIRRGRMVAINTAIVVAVVAFATWVVLVANPYLANRMEHHRGELWLWGALPAALALASWLVAMMTRRRGAARRGRFRPGYVTAVVLVVLAFLVWVAYFGGRLQPHSLADDVPGLARVNLLTLLGAVVLAEVGWLALAVAPAYLSYRRRRLRPGLVDATKGRVKTPTLRVLAAPTVFLGTAVRVSVTGTTAFDLAPGQAVGVSVAKSDIEVRVTAVGRRTRVARVRLDIPGDGQQVSGAQVSGGQVGGVPVGDVTVVVRGGARPRLRVLTGQYVDHFELAQPSFVSPWHSVVNPLGKTAYSHPGGAPWSDDGAAA